VGRTSVTRSNANCFSMVLARRGNGKNTVSLRGSGGCYGSLHSRSFGDIDTRHARLVARRVRAARQAD
jgi:hypothetical protein